MKLTVLGGGGVRMPGFVRAVLAGRPDTFDRIVKCTVLGDILDNDELKPVTVMDEFIVEEGASRQ